MTYCTIDIPARGANAERTHDVLALASENFPEAEALLEPVIENGKLLAPLPSLKQVRERAVTSLSRLPEGVQRLGGAEQFPVEKSSGLRKLLDSVRARYMPTTAGAAGTRKKT